MDVEVNELERLGKRLLVEFVQCVSDMAGVDLGVVGEISSDTGKKFLEPMAAIVDFTGTKTGNFMIAADERTLASILSLDDLPAIDEREAEREEYQGLLTEALNVAAGECLNLLQTAEDSLVTMYAPKVVYGTLRFPQVILDLHARTPLWNTSRNGRRRRDAIRDVAAH